MFELDVFAFFDDPIRIAMLLPPEEILMLTFLLLSASIHLCFSGVDGVKFGLCTAECDCCLCAASKMDCRPLYLMTKPVVDFLVVAHSAQSLSTYSPMSGVVSTVVGSVSDLASFFVA